MSLSKSFTLIELLVVMAIIGLLTTIILVKYSNQELENPEEQAVLQFVSDLRRAQNMAMSVVNCEGSIQEEYCLEKISDKKYKITCNPETEIKVNIRQGSKICFLPIDIGRPTIQITGTLSFTIGETEINISENGQISY